MKKRRLQQSKNVLYIGIGLLILLPAISLFWNYRIAAAEFASSLIVILLTAYRMRTYKNDVRQIMLETARNLGPADTFMLETFPLPVAVISEENELIWYNSLFRSDVLYGRDFYGAGIKTIFNGIPQDLIRQVPGGIDVTRIPAEKGKAVKKYTVFGSPRQDGCYQLYFIDNTDLKNTAAEYVLSRPVIAIIMIDSYDELMQNAKEGEKAEIVSMIEKSLTSWVSQTSGFLRHSDRDKYLFIFEERHYRKFIETRFDILDKVRQISVGEYMAATLSIGVGRGGATFSENEEMARQALDMALGRGGDQAAVRTSSGYEFYGGVSKVVEKRTKVKTRIIASALSELIDGSDNVLIMGHKATDLDFVGAASGLYKAILSRGCNARIVLSRRESLAKGLIDQLEKDGYKEAFVEPEESLFLVTPKTLLIVADTHRKNFVEYPELYKVVKTIAVIDHHRKMVDFIDNAVLFYHEPYASSTSEMVTELVQYIADKSVTVAEASALLAGITLDTKNFSVRTGVRTFEAAAYLRRKGADTAKVKELFSGNMEDYKSRAKLVASASLYSGCAIALGNSEINKNIRLIAPQAADELLEISGVNASFVIYQSENGICISARSMGKVNVQLVMEKLGGGGHLTMAGVQLPGTDMENVKKQLTKAIDEYFSENKKAQ
ncbi:MAG TPA: DHH family phosphoesterase [Ruminiclostridium sp.]|nr:DHH family phosphoesterase [Ruminiclostridium sp.]